MCVVATESVFFFPVSTYWIQCSIVITHMPLQATDLSTGMQLPPSIESGRSTWQGVARDTIKANFKQSI